MPSTPERGAESSVPSRSETAELQGKASRHRQCDSSCIGWPGRRRRDRFLHAGRSGCPTRQSSGLQIGLEIGVDAASADCSDLSNGASSTSPNLLYPLGVWTAIARSHVVHGARQRFGLDMPMFLSGGDVLAAVSRTLRRHLFIRPDARCALSECGTLKGRCLLPQRSSAALRQSSRLDEWFDVTRRRRRVGAVGWTPFAPRAPSTASCGSNRCSPLSGGLDAVASGRCGLVTRSGMTLVYVGRAVGFPGELGLRPLVMRRERDLCVYVGDLGTLV